MKITAEFIKKLAGDVLHPATCQVLAKNLNAILETHEAVERNKQRRAEVSCRHFEEMKNLDSELGTIRASCSHLVTSFQPETAGGGETQVCDICGVVMR